MNRLNQFTKIMHRELPLFILVFLSYGRCNQEFKQERARILFVKPEFAKDYSILTIREGRNSPYLTTLKFTSLQAVGNNITIRIEFATDKAFTYPIRLEYKSCELVKIDWVQDWVKAYSNIPVLTCPLPPGHYELSKFEMPPKHFPIALTNNMDYFGRTILYSTSTKEKLAEFFMELKANHKKG